jgi:hypothetical protein
VSETFPDNVYEPSRIARDMGVDYLDSIGKNHLFFSPVGTDAFWFNKVGVPASGVVTGQDCCKLQSDVDLFGGVLGNFEGNIPSFDGMLRRQPVPLVRQPRQQRPRGLDVHVADVRQHGDSDGHEQ